MADSSEGEDTSLEDLQKDYATIVDSLTACIKGLKALRATTKTSLKIRKGTVTKSLNKVLDKAAHTAVAAGTSYGTAVLEALDGAILVD